LRERKFKLPKVCYGFKPGLSYYHSEREKVKRNSRYTFLVLFIFIYLFCFCSSRQQKPAVTIHYLGHASFILQFDNGVSVLTDYGESKSYGLDSPVFEFGDFLPDIATYSHTEHVDHYRKDAAEKFNLILTGTDSYSIKGLDIRPIRISEKSLDKEDNTSFVFTYKGLTVVHLGDAQGNITAIDMETVREHLKEIYPEEIDLLFMTIGGVTNIIQQAESFVNVLRPKRIIPMHYWSKEDKLSFLSLLKEQNETAGKHYTIKEIEGPQFKLFAAGNEVSRVEVISLEPAPFSQSEK